MKRRTYAFYVNSFWDENQRRIDYNSIQLRDNFSEMADS